GGRQGLKGRLHPPPVLRVRPLDHLLDGPRVARPCAPDDRLGLVHKVLTARVHAIHSTPAYGGAGPRVTAAPPQKGRKVSASRPGTYPPAPRPPRSSPPA